MAARRGFTFIELLTVMIVMGILAAVAAPKYADAMASHRVNLAANRVAADLRMVRQYARKTSVVQTLMFNATTNMYLSTTMPDLNRPSVTYSVNLMNSEYGTDVTAVTFAGGMIQFDVYGRPTAAGSVSLRSGTHTRIVAIDANGLVSVL